MELLCGGMTFETDSDVFESDEEEICDKISDLLRKEEMVDDPIIVERKDNVTYSLDFRDSFSF